MGSIITAVNVFFVIFTITAGFGNLRFNRRVSLLARTGILFSFISMVVAVYIFSGNISRMAASRFYERSGDVTYADVRQINQGELLAQVLTFIIALYPMVLSVVFMISVSEKKSKIFKSTVCIISALILLLSAVVMIYLIPERALTFIAYTFSFLIFGFSLFLQCSGLLKLRMQKLLIPLLWVAGCVQLIAVFSGNGDYSVLLGIFTITLMLQVLDAFLEFPQPQEAKPVRVRFTVITLISVFVTLGMVFGVPLAMYIDSSTYTAKAERQVENLEKGEWEKYYDNAFSDTKSKRTSDENAKFKQQWIEQMKEIADSGFRMNFEKLMTDRDNGFFVSASCRVTANIDGREGRAYLNAVFEGREFLFFSCGIPEDIPQKMQQYLDLIGSPKYR